MPSRRYRIRSDGIHRVLCQVDSYPYVSPPFAVLASASWLKRRPSRCSWEAPAVWYGDGFHAEGCQAALLSARIRSGDSGMEVPTGLSRSTTKGSRSFEAASQRRTGESISCSRWESADVGPKDPSPRLRPEITSQINHQSTLAGDLRGGLVCLGDVRAWMDGTGRSARGRGRHMDHKTAGAGRAAVRLD